MKQYQSIPVTVSRKGEPLKMRVMANDISRTEETEVGTKFNSYIRLKSGKMETVSETIEEINLMLLEL